MIQIRHIKEGDSNGFYELVKRNESRLTEYFPITLEKTATTEQTGETVKMFADLSQKNELHVFVIEQEQTMIGVLFLKNLDQRVKKCELAYFIDKNEEHKGYTSQAIKLAIEYAFQRLGMNKVYCRVAPDNEPSNKAAVKNGFELEGVLKQEFKISDGSLIDLNYYGLLNSN